MTMLFTKTVILLILWSKQCSVHVPEHSRWENGLVELGRFNLLLCVHFILCSFTYCTHMVVEAAKAITVILQTRQHRETDGIFPIFLLEFLWLKTHFFFYVWRFTLWISLDISPDIHKFGPMKGQNWGKSTQTFTDQSYGSNIKSVALKWCNYFPRLCKWDISFSRKNSTQYISYYSWNYYISRLFQIVCYLDPIRVRRKMNPKIKFSARYTPGKEYVKHSAHMFL